MKGTISQKVSHFFGGGNMGVTSKQLNRVGLGRRVAPGLDRTRVDAWANGTGNLHTGQGMNRSFITRDQFNKLHQLRGRKIIKSSAAGAAVGATGLHTSMRPNSNQSRTAYRGPGTMQTPPGTGRFA
jgi:hypothetical protein